MDKLTEAASGEINLVGVAGVCRIDQDLSFLLFAPALRGPHIGAKRKAKGDFIQGSCK